MSDGGAAREGLQLLALQVPELIQAPAPPPLVVVVLLLVP
jgi:hypothetical protein